VFIKKIGFKKHSRQISFPEGFNLAEAQERRNSSPKIVQQDSYPLEQETGYLKIQIIDTGIEDLKFNSLGIGISERAIQKLFNPFTQAEASTSQQIH
jgi:signal transduction histidine kinase